ncbi:hypothetical protein [Thermoflavimicrobium dichotomicum]|uniref:DUF4244 domain-containing protein n=1 Tax=Thermoflavimicrobium dichotomicum TaxID=46223 RepID=A0A1I3QTH4_9BACL|nr:hypothetical protein [Thermoflavimicrobium dichotomicum]SFJ36551.1 hypothetical protein SAMN05421852_10866 [Thermoflavimicrobium dichotomicum]
MWKKVFAGFKRILCRKKGSPTLEYVVIIAVGAAFASLLLWAFSGGERNAITTILREKVLEVISGTVVKK